MNMLVSCGVQYVIIGHSERRHIFKESNNDINKKIHTVLKQETFPIFCIGEKLDDRETNNTRKVLMKQLEEGLLGINKDMMSKIIIAYEPVWAIGTGINAVPKQVEESHDMIREILLELYSYNQKFSNNNSEETVASSNTQISDKTEVEAFCLVERSDLINAKLHKDDHSRFLGKEINFLISFEDKLIVDFSEDDAMSVITGMYGPTESKIEYNFAAIDADILGNIYRPSEKTPAATVRRLMKQESIKTMVEIKTKEILAKKDDILNQADGDRRRIKAQAEEEFRSRLNDTEVMGEALKKSTEIFEISESHILKITHRT